MREELLTLYSVIDAKDRKIKELEAELHTAMKALKESYDLIERTIDALEKIKP